MNQRPQSQYLKLHLHPGRGGFGCRVSFCLLFITPNPRKMCYPTGCPPTMLLGLAAEPTKKEYVVFKDGISVPSLPSSTSRPLLKHSKLKKCDRMSLVQGSARLVECGLSECIDIRNLQEIGHLMSCPRNDPLQVV